VLRILIAADHEVVRRGMRSLLEERRQWRICGEAATAVETIRKMKTLCPDLLLLDLAMPDMEATKAIPQIINICPNVKIVALGMQGFAELAAKALAAGASGLALKSDTASDLVLTVRSMKNNQPYLSPAAVTMIRSALARPRTSGPTPTDLTMREFEILELLARGRSNKEVASALGISVKTVNAHRTNITRKLKFRSYSDLVQFAIRHGVIEI